MTDIKLTKDAPEFIPKPIIQFSTAEQLKLAVIKQVEFYFSPENIATDTYLNSQMDNDGYVNIATIATFGKVKALCDNIEELTDTLTQANTVELNEDRTKIRSTFKKQKRTTVILREMPQTTTAESIEKVFNKAEGFNKPKEIKPDIQNCWYVIFEEEEDAKKASLWVRGQTLEDGTPIHARLKAENMYRSYYTGETQPPYAPAVYMPYNQGGRWNGRNYANGEYPNYKNDNRGHRRGGRRKEYSRNKGRGGYNNRDENRNKKRNNRKRTNSQKKHASPQLTLSQFPPLPLTNEVQSGYDKPFTKYSKDTMLNIITSMKEVSKPEEFNKLDASIVLSKPKLTLAINEYPNDMKAPNVLDTEESKEPTNDTKVEQSNNEAAQATLLTAPEQNVNNDTKKEEEAQEENCSKQSKVESQEVKSESDAITATTSSTPENKENSSQNDSPTWAQIAHSKAE